MNTGAEAVESAIKVARKWGYEVKGVPDGPGEDHRGRRQLPRPDHDHRQLLRPTRSRATTSGRSPRASSTVPYGDAAALEPRDRRRHGRGADRADPGRGRRAGPAGRLPARPCASSAPSTNVLFIADEIQSGLGPHRRTFACEHEDVRPDVYMLGKALGGGIVPVSAVVAQPRGPRRAPARQAWQHVRRQPAGLRRRPRRRAAAGDGGVPGAGPRSSVNGCDRLRRMIGRASSPSDARPVGRRRHRPGCDRPRALRAPRRHGVLAKDTHGSTIRLAPPIVVEAADLDWMADQLAAVLADV